MTEYEKTRMFDILVGYVYHNLRTLNYVHLVSGGNLTNVKQKVYLGNSLFVKDLKDTFWDFCCSLYTKFVYLITLAERQILVFFGVGFNHLLSNNLSGIFVLSRVTSAFSVEIRHEVNTLVFVLLNSAIEFVHSKPKVTKNYSWLELPSFSFFFMFPWFAATVSYELLY